MTKFQLTQALLTNNSAITVVAPSGEKVTGYLQSVTREDGSGNNFIVELNTGKNIRKIFVRIPN